MAFIFNYFNAMNYFYQGKSCLQRINKKYKTQHRSPSGLKVAWASHFPVSSKDYECRTKQALEKKFP